MTDRDELLAAMKAHSMRSWTAGVGSVCACGWEGVNLSAHTVDELLAAGWRKTREITATAELDALPVDTLIVASGTYLRGKGGFHNCWAIPVPAYISGITERTWWVLVHGDDWVSSLTTTSRITEARVLYTPEGSR